MNLPMLQRHSDFGIFLFFQISCKLTKRFKKTQIDYVLTFLEIMKKKFETLLCQTGTDTISC